MRGAGIAPAEAAAPPLIAAPDSFGARDLDVQLMEFAVERIAADIERLGYIAHVPTLLLQHLQQHLPRIRLNWIEFDVSRRLVVRCRAIERWRSVRPLHGRRMQD